MQEKKLIKMICKTLTKSSYIGDDCAYLKDLNALITQDSLIEGVHFSREFATAEEIGYKAIMVNLSDIYASGGKPEYLTVSLSLPKNIQETWVKGFYTGVNRASVNGIEVVGGDITGSKDKIYISICAIGNAKNKNISSRKNAKEGDLIIVSGEHGSSKAGLDLLQQGKTEPKRFIKAHLLPQSQRKFSEIVSQNVKRYAMMDTSDGLAEALFQIAKMSNYSVAVEFNKIPYDKELEKIYPKNFKDIVLYGGEDYKLVASVSPKDLDKIDKNFYTIIGRVLKSDFSLKIDDTIITEESLNSKIFNHFK